MNQDMKLEALAAMMGGQGASHIAVCPKCGHEFEMEDKKYDSGEPGLPTVGY
jgi:hypothetical protein